MGKGRNPWENKWQEDRANKSLVRAYEPKANLAGEGEGIIVPLAPRARIAGRHLCFFFFLSFVSCFQFSRFFVRFRSLCSSFDSPPVAQDPRQSGERTVNMLCRKRQRCFKRLN